ncbi:hypothetical protein NLG97_g10775 [Lecanicillium saksenae]|uniref:Uncharacterized protein n=1 Tax=Lecanicillium saksenae TaxID=468837 RepID=A0ACC1QF81_9HYPO|nr:hypothetical protein NLG97_g10775 [Lecanicillium saksenae]
MVVETGRAASAGVEVEMWMDGERVYSGYLARPGSTLSPWTTASPTTTASSTTLSAASAAAAPHDTAAEKIATDGRDWADRVLRKDDMEVYVLRLLLEYARLLDDRRESMGWVQDVLSEPALKKLWKQW